MQALLNLETQQAPTISLRGYQQDMVDDLIKAMGYSKQVMVYLGTGGGKTILSAEFARLAELKGKRMLFCVHLDPLVRQTVEKFSYFGVNVGVIKAGWPENRQAPIQVGSLQSMARREWWQFVPWDVVVLDEAHTTAFSKTSAKIRRSMAAIKKQRPHWPGMWEIGLTATPWQLSARRSMSDHYDKIVMGPMPQEIIDMGYLVPLRYYSLPQADLTGVETKAGDYNEGQLSVACNRPAVIEAAVREWKRLAEGKRTIGFCVDIAHTENVAKAFRKAGYRSAFVTGNTPGDERLRLYHALKTGEIDVLTSCNVLSVGFDEPSVEVGLMMRPTQSKSLWFQQVGRVMRISPETGKTHGLILDQAGNCEPHGLTENIVARDITLGCTKQKKGKGEAMTKTCPECQRVCTIFATECPQCGHRFPQTAMAPVGELVEYIDSVPKDQRQKYREFLFQALRENRASTSADFWFHEHYGFRPKTGHRRHACFEEPTEDAVRRYWMHHLKFVPYKGQPWIKRVMTAEFGDYWKQFEKDLFLPSHHHRET